MKPNVIILLCVLLSSCGIRVQYDYDRQYNFSEAVSYAYYPELNTELSQLDERRLLSSIDSVLQSRGYVKTNTPALYINLSTSTRPKPVNSVVGLGVGGSNRHIGGGLSVDLPLGKGEAYREIVFDVVDVESDQLIWQAVSEATVSDQMTPVDREAQLKAVVIKVFSKFPPSRN